MKKWFRLVIQFSVFMVMKVGLFSDGLLEIMMMYNDIENQSLLDIEEDLKNCTQNLKIPDVIMEKIKETLKQYYIDNCDGKDDACDEN